MTTAKRKQSYRDRAAYMREWRKNISYYENHKRELLKKYRNKWIAITNQEVLDVDKDRLALYDRVLKTVGDKPLFVTEVREKPRIY